MYVPVVAFIGALLSCTAEICSDLEKVYTECTVSSTDRWEVAVSTNNNCTLPPPIKVAGCYKTCEKGEILKNFAECTKCLPGSFSAGDQKHFPVLDPAEFPDISFLSTRMDMSPGSDCQNIKVEGGMVVLPNDLCDNTITLPFTLLKPGSLHIRFLYSDSRTDLTFKVIATSSSNCGNGNVLTETLATAEPNWQEVQIPVAQRGNYLLRIKSLAFFNIEPVTSENSLPRRPARIGRLVITGVEPYTSCTLCPKGTVAPTEGSGECVTCPHNTYSDDGVECRPCSSSDQYGDGTCKARVANCPATEYWPSVGPCTAGKSSVVSVMRVPNKCLEEGPSETYPCLECQPGSERVGDGCQFCPTGSHNSGNTVSCQPCNPNTISFKGQYHVWWSEIPAGWTAQGSQDVVTLVERESWAPAGPFLLGLVHDTQPISLNFGEVEFSSKSINVNVVGLFMLEFQLVCQGHPCRLRVIRGDPLQPGTQELLQSFDSSTVPRHTFHHNVLSSANTRQQFSVELSGEGSYLKIYSVNFTNTVEGGSSYCLECLQGDGCMDCAPGMIYKNGKCEACPEDTYHVITGSLLTSDYKSECTACRAPTRSARASTTCYLPCDNVTTLSGKRFDLSLLGEEITYDQPDSYPDQQGNTFHYRYLLDLCQRYSEHQPSTEDSPSNGLVRQVSVVTSREGKETVRSPANKGDMLTELRELENGIVLQYTTHDQQAAAGNCTSVTTNVTLICNRDHTGKLTLVQHDSCSLEFQGNGPYGCRACLLEDYRSIPSSCEKDTATLTITYVLKEGVLCSGGVSLPSDSTEACTPYSDTLTDTLKRFKGFVLLGVGTLLCLIVGLCLMMWYSSTLKHKLDGYSRMSYADNDDYTGAKNEFTWGESEDEEELGVQYSRPQGPSPGTLLTEKLSKFSNKFGKGSAGPASRNDGTRDIMLTQFQI